SVSAIVLLIYKTAIDRTCSYRSYIWSYMVIHFKNFSSNHWNFHHKMYNLCHRTKLYFLTIHISKKTVSNIDTNFKGGIFVTMKEKISIIVPIYNVERYL